MAHCLEVGARRVAVFSRDELKQSEMANRFRDDRLRFLLGSVTDEDRMVRALSGVDYVVHAAAMKQVPACEAHPWEATATNIDGTWAVAKAAIKAEVERAIFLSTDKAANANTLYGATKFAAERLWNESNVYAARTRTRLAATRYGNVISSRGSVVPLFKAQAATGRLTITDRRMTRFWMTLEQAVRLVEMALGESRGGEVFIPKVPSAPILTVAEAVAPGVPWIETGIRPGEKLHETLITEDEARAAFDCGDHYRLEPHRKWGHLPALNAPSLPDGFVYRSDTNEDQLTVERMRGLL